MAEELLISAEATRQQRYQELVPQIKSLLLNEPNLIANLANVAAALKQVFHFFWVGFYLVEGNSLVLGPFQGPIACTRIPFGKGVCGTAWKEARTVIVPDVESFPGHIACSSASKSEIVVPVLVQGRVAAVLDVDSDRLGDFSEVDARGLKSIVDLIPWNSALPPKV